MKNIITILALISILIAGCSSTGTHDILEKSGKGIDCTSHYNKEKIISLWGEPSSYESNDSEFGKDERYEYNGNLITFEKGGILSGFDVENTDFTVIWAGFQCVWEMIFPRCRTYKMPPSKTHMMDI